MSDRPTTEPKCDVCGGFDPPRTPYWRDNQNRTCDPCEARIQQHVEIALADWAEAAQGAAPGLYHRNRVAKAMENDEYRAEYARTRDIIEGAAPRHKGHDEGRFHPDCAACQSDERGVQPGDAYLPGAAPRHQHGIGVYANLRDTCPACQSGVAAPRAEPWDHPYDGDSDWPDRCIHCGFVGSYAHTEEFYRKWVHPGAAPRAEGLPSDEVDDLVQDIAGGIDGEPYLDRSGWERAHASLKVLASAARRPSDERVPESHPALPHPVDPSICAHQYEDGSMCKAALNAHHHRDAPL